MQVKIIIGTIAFMLTMIILGFAALREPHRLEKVAASELGRSIESGAQLYYANCVECHGVEGKAETCLDGTGVEIACKGRALNYRGLVCGEPSSRMEEYLWEGSKFSFIELTIAGGRSATEMPTWSQEFGGPLQPADVEHITRFIMNWEGEELCAKPPLEFPWPETFDELIAMDQDAVPAETVAAYAENEIILEMPLNYPGDAARGEELFGLEYGCTACHGNPADPAAAASTGPDLDDISVTGATRIDGYSAEQYLYESILNPSAFLAPECPNGDCADAMLGNFGERMSNNPQDLMDIMTFLFEN